MQIAVEWAILDTVTNNALFWPTDGSLIEVAFGIGFEDAVVLRFRWGRGLETADVDFSVLIAKLHYRLFLIMKHFSKKFQAKSLKPVSRVFDRLHVNFALADTPDGESG